MSKSMIEKKVVLVGDGGVGKTIFVKCLMDQDFDPKYIATLGVEVHPVLDNERNIQYNIWDTAGQEKFGGLRDGYYINADIAIIMYSVDNKLAAKSVDKWEKDIRDICGDIPIHIIGNKMDCKHKRIISDNTITCKNDFNKESIFTLLSDMQQHIYPSEIKILSTTHKNNNIIDIIKHFALYSLIQTKENVIENLFEQNIWSPYAMINLVIRMNVDGVTLGHMKNDFKFEILVTQEPYTIINGTLKDWIFFISENDYQHNDDLTRKIRAYFPQIDQILLKLINV